ncbi:orotidine-5'-phosphate decarboxylase [Actinotalea solisilvae]|uniref:orotidine-5'-phosphate decarboxylase n=1 Tax=Actinotalea solisilvae TaxID=2072922 RepID=UPI0018F1A6F5|nr:orotidine-5'-phosphate decarboxylase [Actinotalea solisilvae]
MSGPSFGARLADAMDRLGPLCVGVDPHPSLLAAWGLGDDADGLRTFSLTVVEALAGRVAAIKPQSAFFERHGSAGVAVLEEVLAAVRSAAGGTQVICDAKRGDIGSTMAGYADAYLRDGAPLACDALTVSPYLGVGSLAPAVETAAATGRGLFVLALTSNPEGAEVQHARSPSGRPVAAVVAAAAAALNGAALGDGPGLGSVGLVVGATVAKEAQDLGIDLAAVRGPLLAPGVGAQGAGGLELAAFGAARRSVLASTSRAVLGAGPDREALRAAAAEAAAEATAALR